PVGAAMRIWLVCSDGRPRAVFSTAGDASDCVADHGGEVQYFVLDTCMRTQRFFLGHAVKLKPTDASAPGAGDRERLPRRRNTAPRQRLTPQQEVRTARMTESVCRHRGRRYAFRSGSIEDARAKSQFSQCGIHRRAGTNGFDRLAACGLARPAE